VRDVGLKDAREGAAGLRGLLAKDIDPLDAKATMVVRDAAVEARKGKAMVAATRTFMAVAEMLLADHEAGWRNAKHRQQWRNTLASYAYPILGELPVAEVTTDHVLAALRPIWTVKPETASRVRGRMEAVLAYAKARGWRAGENVAVWRGHLAAILASSAKVRRVQHHPALPWKDMPAFMSALRSAKGTAARALEFAILTAARSGEVRGVCWGEVNFTDKLWTVPGDRMKAGTVHRVPLGDAALAVLEAARALRQDDTPAALVFPGTKQGVALSDMSISAVIRRMNSGDAGLRWKDEKGEGVVPHGFRSTFRDWCAEAKGAPREVAEAALAHTLRDKTEAAYQRGDLLEIRRELMTSWQEFCSKEQPQCVLAS
jgi:integrase